MKITCTGCRRSKPAEAFGVDRRRATGRRDRCKECRAAAARERRAAARNGPATVLTGPWKKAAEPASAADGLDAHIGRMEAHGAALRVMAEAEAALGRGVHAQALERALAALGVDDLDAAAVEVARTMARAFDGALDDPHALAVLQPRYTAALKACGLTRDSAGRPTAGRAASRRLPESY